MVNHLSKFSPNFADKTKPLHELLNKQNQWVCGDPQQREFKDIKKALVSSPVLSLFEPNRKRVVAYSCGLGARRAIFARHGIPEIVISDHGPQYASKEYFKFASDYQFEHITSSPHYPQSNGEAERAVQTVKSLLKKKGDPYL